MQYPRGVGSSGWAAYSVTDGGAGVVVCVFPSTGTTCVRRLVQLRFHKLPTALTMADKAKALAGAMHFNYSRLDAKIVVS